MARSSDTRVMHLPCRSAEPTAKEKMDAQAKANKELAEVHGESFVTVYTEVKEIEYAEFMKVISPWEREHLLLHV